MEVFKIKKGYVTGLALPSFEKVNNELGYCTQLIVLDDEKKTILDKNIILSNFSQEEALKNLENIINFFSLAIGRTGTRADKSKFTYLLKPVSLLYMYNELLAISGFEPLVYIELSTLELYSDKNQYINRLKEKEKNNIYKEISRLRLREAALMKQLKAIDDFK